MKGLVIAATTLVLAAPSVALASDATVKRTLLAGATEIRTAKGEPNLEQKLAVIRARLRTDRATTPKGRQARVLALDGFTWMLKGVREGVAVTDALDLAAPDDLDALAKAVAGATRVHRMQARGAKLLCAAGASIGVRVRLGAFRCV